MNEKQAASWIDIADLKPWSKNPRQNDEAAKALAQTLKRFGPSNWGAPIVARLEDSMIIAGHTRVKAAQLLGWTHVPVRYVDLSLEEAEAMALADNKMGELADWSESLGDVLKALEEAGASLDDLGWDAEELEALTSDLDSDDDFADVDDEDLDQLPDEVEAITEKGDVIELGSHVLHCGDCIEVLNSLDDNSVDAIVTDPPYGIGFMSKDWDCDVPGDEFAAQAFRVLKPGGHIIAFAACRTIHRLMTNLEDAGFEIRDLISWLQWQGFPKSLDVSKAIDKDNGHWRGKASKVTTTNRSMSGPNYERTLKGKPVTPKAKQWSGWGTGLKPSHEPAVLARKPLEGTVVENVLKWGTGALNVDACRYEVGDKGWPGPSDDLELSDVGRWPANLYHCPKPSRGEREEGCDDLADRVAASPAGPGGWKEKAVKNIHPTVKPTTLMRWLVRMVTPKNGTLVEPFCGSGTTLLAAEVEGVQCVAIEREPKYCDIIRARFGGLDGR